MNKQEAIEEIKNLEGLTILDKTINFDSKMISKKKVLNIVKQLDGPEKPVVPQFVADMIIKRKTAGQSVIKAIENLRFYEDACGWVRNNGETFVKAWLYGYEVKKKKLYEVFLKRTGAQLGVCVPHGEDKTQFTKVELQEYGFDDLDVYDVKEVEE
ncbi:hypothetical protein Si067_01088 [Streptococcus infantarius subsp. infantarius]|nr:hypothetical protein [Streptococcus infantarius subsp. infantarius]